jgi:hypothetical protein
MQYIFLFVVACALMVLTGCGGTPDKDYEASVHCQDLGYQPGTKGYDDCLTEEKMQRLLQEQEARQEMQEIRHQQQLMANPH